MATQLYTFNIRDFTENTENNLLEPIISAIKVYLNKFDDLNDSNKNPVYIAALEGVVRNALQNKSYLTPRVSTKHRIKIAGNFKDCVCIYNPDKFVKQETKEKDDETIEALKYDVIGLPAIADILANGIDLTEGSIDLRIYWITKEIEYKLTTETKDVTTTDSQMTRLLRHLVDHRKFQYEFAWKKIVRCFLTGLVMDIYYRTTLAKKRSKKSKKGKNDNTIIPIIPLKISEYVDAKINVISSCTSTLLKKESVIEMYSQILVDKFYLLTSEKDYNFNETKKELVKDLRTDIKISYLLYHFVKMFGFIVLVSFPMVTDKYLLQKLNFKDLEEMEKNFNLLLERKKFGDDIITANITYGEKIKEVVLEYANNIKVKNNTIVNELLSLLDNYKFNVYYDKNKVKKENENNSLEIQNKRSRYAGDQSELEYSSSSSSRKLRKRNERKDPNSVLFQELSELRKEKTNNKIMFEQLQSELNTIRNAAQTINQSNQFQQNTQQQQSQQKMQGIPQQIAYPQQQQSQQNIQEKQYPKGQQSQHDNYQLNQQSDSQHSFMPNHHNKQDSNDNKALITTRRNYTDDFGMDEAVAAANKSIEEGLNEKNIAAFNENHVKLIPLKLNGTKILQNKERTEITNNIATVEKALSKDVCNYLRSVAQKSKDEDQQAINFESNEDKELIAHYNSLLALTSEGFVIHKDDELNDINDHVLIFYNGLSYNQKTIFNDYVFELTKKIEADKNNSINMRNDRDKMILIKDKAKDDLYNDNSFFNVNDIDMVHESDSDV